MTRRSLVVFALPWFFALVACASCTPAAPRSASSPAAVSTKTHVLALEMTVLDRSLKPILFQKTIACNDFCWSDPVVQWPWATLNCAAS